MEVMDVEENSIERPIRLVNNPTIDIDSYISNYTGSTRYIRLEFIGDRCPPLREEAYKLAINEIKGTLNTREYLKVIIKLNDHYLQVGKPSVSEDKNWVNQTNRDAHAKLEKYESELKSYKQNLIKESIRACMNDIGRHYYMIGDSNNALKNYSKTRDYCILPKHILEMCFNVIKTSIEMGNFDNVFSYCQKAEFATDLKTEPLVHAKLFCCQGLASLHFKRYRAAANLFLDVTFELENGFNDVLSAVDIATYGGLCALASFNRREIKTKVLDNQKFREYLELSPLVRELIECFYHSRYTQLLKILDQLEPDALLDIHLHSHVETLFKDIRNKAIIQYVSPFQSVDLNQMSQTFTMPISSLESRIVTMIMENTIKGRIDSQNKVLFARQEDLRSSAFDKTLNIGKSFERNMNMAILRSNMIQADFVVKDSKGEGQSKF